MRRNDFAPGDRPTAGTIVFSVTAAVFLSRFWLVLLAGSDVPFWDQWDGEALGIYKPFLEGTLRFARLFQPHNEHRIVFTHLLNLALLKLNGQWDPLVQMIAGAAIHSATAGMLTWFLMRLARGLERIALAAVVLAIFCLPFGWENTLWGFQSQVYFLIFFSLPALALLGLGRNRAADWIAGIACTLGAFISMGSSAAVGLSLAALGAVIARDPHRFRRGIALIGSGILVFALITFATPTVPDHVAYRASDPFQFLALFASTISWPLELSPVCFLATNMPLILLGGLRLLRRIEPDKFQDAAILLGTWAAAIGAGFAYYRGGIETDSLIPASRYFDFLCFLVLANALALAALVRASGIRSRILRSLPGIAWGAAIAVGLAMITGSSWTNIIGPRIDHPHFRSSLVTLLQRTGDPSVLDRYPIAIYPSPSPAVLQRTLGDQQIAAILPPSIHPGIPLKFADSENAVFTKGGFYQPGEPPGYYPMRTSFSAETAHRAGISTSEPFAVKLGAIEVTVAGVLPKGGGSLSLVPDDGGPSIHFLVSTNTPNGWMTIRRRVPPGVYRLEAESDSKSGWFAFSLPRPVGPLSFVVREIQPYATWFVVLASVSGLAALLAAGRSETDTALEPHGS